MEEQFEAVKDQLKALTIRLFGFLKSHKDKMKRYKENELDTKLQFSKEKKMVVLVSLPARVQLQEGMKAILYVKI